MYLFFDTETTGVPKNYKAPVSDTANWPRLVQIAWQEYDENGNFVISEDFIIKPEGFIIPGDAVKIHGITTERAISDGRNLIEILEKFSLLLDRAEFLVGHNLSFDEKIVGAEFYRKSIKNTMERKKKICTMLGSVEFCKIPGNYGYKWPRLSELYYILFGTNYTEQHNAASDISATAKCFWKLKEKQIL